MQSRHNVDEEEHRRAFEHSSISQVAKAKINRIRNNDPKITFYQLNDYIGKYFFGPELELLGRYVSENDHLVTLYIDLDCAEDVSLLFKRLTKSRSLKTLTLFGNEFGTDLVSTQSMLPFLRNTPSLTKLDITMLENPSFGLILDALHGGSIETLTLCDCNLEDIAALEQCTLPRLRHLHMDQDNIHSIPPLDKYTSLETLRLGNNTIGVEGCRSLAKLLKHPSSRLRELILEGNVIDDAGAEILANSLKRNIVLDVLDLSWNNFGEAGHRAFLKLLNDVSSIENTLKSNHTLTTLKLPMPANDSDDESTGDSTDGRYMGMQSITYFLWLNRNSGGARHLAAAEKVTETQLDSATREELCDLQNFEYSYSSIFAEIEPLLLPEVIALTGDRHGQNDLYRMLVASVPGLASIVNKKVALAERMAERASCKDALNGVNAVRVNQLLSLHAVNTRKQDTCSVKRSRETAAIDAK